MEISKTLYVTDRKKWRAWLEKNHKKEKVIWLIYYKKASGKPRIPYHEAVEEALCFGWIDSTAKRIDEERFAQRFTPRRKGSKVSELNKARMREMIRQGKMTAAGLEAAKHEKNGIHDTPKLILKPDVKKALQEDPVVWKNFQNFPHDYKVVRIGFIEMARGRKEVFETRLNFFKKRTAKNIKYGITWG